MVVARDALFADKVRQWLSDGKIRACPCCGSKNLGLSRFVTAGEYDPTNDDIVRDRHVPMAQVRCNDCCHLMHFDLESMGLLQKAEGTPSAN